MDIRELCKSPEKFIAFIHQTDEIFLEQDKFFNDLVSGIESKFQRLIDEEPSKQDDFIVPDIPKLKKEPKDKRESRAAKKLLSTCDKSINPSDTFIVPKSTEDVVRRSARVASKSKVIKESIPNISNQSVNLKSPPTKSNEAQNIFGFPSPSLPPLKIRRTNDTEPFQSMRNVLKQILDETVCTANMKEPLGASTPTDVAENKENLNHLEVATPITSDQNFNEPKTPVSEFNRQIKGESVKKRVEEFEKRNKAAIVSKLPVKTPEKKQLSSLSKNKTTNDTTDSKAKVFVEKESTSSKGRVTRNNSKVLREQSANIKLIKEKGHEAQKKKEVIMKASAEEAKRKREERSRKVAARREAAEKEKAEIALKLEKEKEEKLRLIQKQKEEKLRLEIQKKKLAANSKCESSEYAIDHVLDGASSDEEEKPKNPIPIWASKESRKQQLKIQAWINKEKVVYPWFFNKNLKYPKIEELFSAEVKMRPRTSSAFWNTKVTFDESFPLV